MTLEQGNHWQPGVRCLELLKRGIIRDDQVESTALDKLVCPVNTLASIAELKQKNIESNLRL